MFLKVSFFLLRLFHVRKIWAVGFFSSTYLICRLSSGELAENSRSAPSWPHAQFYAAGGLFYRGFGLACQGGARCPLATTRIQIRGERTGAGGKFDGFFIFKKSRMSMMKRFPKHNTQVREPDFWDMEKEGER